MVLNHPFILLVLLAVKSRYTMFTKGCTNSFCLFFKWKKPVKTHIGMLPV